MLTCRQVLNKTFLTSDGRFLGKLASVIVDEDWSIPLFSVALEREVAKEFAIHKPLFGSSKTFLEPSEVAALSDNIVLKKRLEEMPDCFQERGVGMEGPKLLGRKVLGDHSYYFGDLEDMVLDRAHWRVSDLIVEVRKKASDDMGFPLTIFGTSKAKVPVKQVEAIRDHILLSLDPEGFREYVVKERLRD